MIKLNKPKICIMFFIVALIILLVIGFSSALIYSEKINEGASSVSSDQALTCYWYINSDANVNITWYLNSVINTTQENISCINGVQCSTSGNGNIPASFTTRGDNWKCGIYAPNENKNTSVNISNAPPEPPRIFYYANNTEINNYAEILEDNVTEFIVNSTDPDGDSIIYTNNDSTYCTIGPISGILNCTPTTNAHIGARRFKIGAEDDWSAQFTNLTVNVTPVNDAPDFTISDQTTKQNQTLNITFTASDEEPDYPLNISVISSVSCISSYGKVGGSDTSFFIYCNPVAYIYEIGNYTVYVNITDSPANMSYNKTTSRNFTLEIISVNHNPNITTSLSNTTGTQNQNYTLMINATDVDNNTLIFSTAVQGCSLSNPWNIYEQNSVYNATTNTTNAYAIINLTLNNSHIACRNITFIASDGAGGNSTLNVLLNLTNVNDNPIIYNESYYSTNLPAINIYLQNLIGYEGAPFSYRINATDPDTITYENDALVYTANETFINSSMNHTTGLISFTPNSSHVGNRTIKITVRDNHGATYNETMYLNISPNSIPYFTAMPNFTCAEYDAANYPYDCFINISEYVNDTADDNISYYEDNTSIFNINSGTGIINFSVLQSNVGNHTIKITIYDTKNASNSTTMHLEINATNNPPALSAIDLSTMNIVETYPITYSISASDSDLGSTLHENILFNMVSNTGVISFLTLQQNSNTSATLVFNPQLGDAGNYSINITVTDYYNNISEQTYINFTVLNKTNAPDINQIKPYGTPISGYTVFDWYENNLTNFPNKTTNINLTENITVNFYANVSDEVAPVNNILLKWYYDSILNKTANGSATETDNNASLYLGFFSSGNHNLTIVVSNPYYENNSFTWLINLSNTNRNPELKTSLENKGNINGTTTYAGYLSTYNTTPQRGFYDADDDLNSNGSLDGNEVNHLNYSYNQTSCSIGNISISGNDVTITPNAKGTCNVTFRATDSEGLYKESGLVVFTVIDLNNGTQQQQQQNIYTSRTTTITQTITIPLPEEVEKPRPLRILAPKVITIYQNKTIKIPISVQNAWNDTLKIIYLTAEANVSNVTFRFEKSYFPSLAVGEIQDTSLEVFNYREGGPYEITVQANVSEPPYTDTATIYINSLEKLSEGDEIATKISFARDLLTQNPECEELNELLSRAEKEMQNGNFEESRKLIDGVMNGCKYLVENTKKANTERPSKILQFFFSINRKYINYGLVALLAIILVIGIYYVFMRAPKKPPENQNTQNLQGNENTYSSANRNIPRNY